MAITGRSVAMPKRSLTLTAALIARTHPHPVAADERGPGCGGCSAKRGRPMSVSAVLSRAGPDCPEWRTRYGHHTLTAALIARTHPHPVAADERGPGCGMALMGEAEAAPACRESRAATGRTGGASPAPSPRAARPREIPGRCRGFAYRIAGPDLREAVRPVWRREMRGRGYDGGASPAPSPRAARPREIPAATSGRRRRTATGRRDALTVAMPKRSLTLTAALIARTHPHPVAADERGPGPRTVAARRSATGNSGRHIRAP
jgi:hypothetical protein